MESAPYKKSGTNIAVVGVVTRYFLIGGLGLCSLS